MIGSGGSSNQGGQAQEGFNKMKEKMGMMAGKTMTREEAMAILNIEEGDKLDSDKESEPELDEEG